MKYVILFLALTGCTDGFMAQANAVGKPHDITCYSGGVAVYTGRSTGMVSNEDKSDGYYFKDAKTGRLITTNAQCVITAEP